MKQVRLVRKHRCFTIEFKREMVKLFESGKFSVSQLSSLYAIGPQCLYRWIYKLSTFNEKGARIVEMKQSSSAKLKALQQQVKHLEQLLGQKQIKIDFLEEMIAVAKEELKIDIKKKSSTPQSTGSARTKRN